MSISDEVWSEIDEDFIMDQSDLSTSLFETEAEDLVSQSGADETIHTPASDSRLNDLPEKRTNDLPEGAEKTMYNPVSDRRSDDLPEKRTSDLPEGAEETIHNPTPDSRSDELPEKRTNDLSEGVI